MNNVSLVGRLTKDPELKYTPNGQAVCSFSMAVDNPFAKDGQADFINCLTWQKSAENLAQYCKKGRMISVVGRIQTRNFEGNDGRKVYVTEVLANDIRYLPEAQKAVGGESLKSTLTDGSTKVTTFDPDDLPFN